MLKSQRQKKYLVAGANSFLATELIARLKGHAVTGIYHIQTQHLPADLNAVPVSAMEKLKDEYDVVFIISAYVPGKGKPADEKLLMEVNVDLPEKICRQFRSAKVIYASSVSVYGETMGLLTENAKGLNPSLYGTSKLKGEEVVRAHAGYSIVRIASMYGNGMNRSTFIPQIIDSALKDKKITLFGDGSRMQNYIHVSDVAEFFIRAADREENGIFLAAAEQSVSNKEIAKEIISILKETRLEFEDGDQGRSFSYSAEQTYAKLGYRPMKNIHEGISELIQWQQKMYW